jgi:hypothetical protein
VGPEEATGVKGYFQSEVWKGDVSCFNPGHVYPTFSVCVWGAVSEKKTHAMQSSFLLLYTKKNGNKPYCLGSANVHN